MSEKDIEQYLVNKVRQCGGKAYKFVSPGNAGVPDRLVIFPNGEVIFVELKASGKVPTVLQTAKHRELRKLNQKVLVIDNKQLIEDLIKSWQAGVIK